MGLENIKFGYLSSELEPHKKYNSFSTPSYNFIQGKDGKAIFFVYNLNKNVLEFYELNLDKE